MTARRVYECLGFVTLSWAAFLATGGAQTAPTAPGAGPAQIDGVLIDAKCSVNAQSRIVPGSNPHLEGGLLWAYTHTRKCALMPECQRSGYGIATHDNRFLLFDAAGNRKALALLQASKKEDDLEINVTGEVQGNTIKVATITWW
jgi:hypothetical protein